MSPLEILEKLDDAALATIAEAAIRILDTRSGDPEAEDADEDCCEAGDDIGSKNQRVYSFSHCAEHGLGYAGDPDDAEESDEMEEDDPAECDTANQGWNRAASHEYAAASMAPLFGRPK